MIPVKASANASNMSYCYEVGKLALKLLPIVLSRIKTPDQLKVYGNAGFLRRRQPFLLLKNHRLESEEAQAKARAMQKQLFEGVTLIPLRAFFLDLIILNVIERQQLIRQKYLESTI